LNITIDLFKQNTGKLIQNIPAEVNNSTLINFIKNEDLPFLSLQKEDKKRKAFLVFNLNEIKTTGQYEQLLSLIYSDTSQKDFKINI